MGSSNRFVEGAWNFICDFCGKRAKSVDGEKTWNNHWVCKTHKEKRNPQDFPTLSRGEKPLPWSRSGGADVFVSTSEVIRDKEGEVIYTTDGSALFDTGE